MTGADSPPKVQNFENFQKIFVTSCPISSKLFENLQNLKFKLKSEFLNP